MVPDELNCRLGDLGVLLLAKGFEQILLLCRIPVGIRRKSILFFEDALLNRFEIDIDFLSCELCSPFLCCYARFC